MAIKKKAKKDIRKGKNGDQKKQKRRLEKAKMAIRKGAKARNMSSRSGQNGR